MKLLINLGLLLMLLICNDVWHARLGHVNYSYVMKLQRLGLINMHDKQSSKCDICVESKITKKTCHL